MVTSILLQPVLYPDRLPSGVCYMSLVLQGHQYLLCGESPGLRWDCVVSWSHTHPTATRPIGPCTQLADVIVVRSDITHQAITHRSELVTTTNTYAISVATADKVPEGKWCLLREMYTSGRLLCKFGTISAVQSTRLVVICRSYICNVAELVFVFSVRLAVQ